MLTSMRVRAIDVALVELVVMIDSLSKTVENDGGNG